MLRVSKSTCSFWFLPLLLSQNCVSSPLRSAPSSRLSTSSSATCLVSVTTRKASGSMAQQADDEKTTTVHIRYGMGIRLRIPDAEEAREARELSLLRLQGEFKVCYIHRSKCVYDSNLLFCFFGFLLLF